MKLSKLKPSMKLKRRYLLIDAESKEVVDKVILDYIGILGYAKAAPVFVKYDKGIVLAVERKSLDNVRASFELSNEKIKVLRVSGTLKGLKK
jgi:RNase P/RNase MRP subunit POP5